MINFTARLTRLKSREARLLSRLENIYNARLIAGVGVFIGLTVAITRGPHGVELLLAGSTVLLLSFLWWRSSQIRDHLQDIQDQIAFYQRNQARIGERSKLEGVRGVHFHEGIGENLGAHFQQLASDVDLLGPSGFLAQISETFTYEGELGLAAQLVSSRPIRRKSVEGLSHVHAHLRRFRLEGARFSRHAYGSLSDSFQLWKKPFVSKHFPWLLLLLLIVYVGALSSSLWLPDSTTEHVPWLVFWVIQAAVLISLGGAHGEALSLLLPLSRGARLFAAARELTLRIDEGFSDLRTFDLSHRLRRAERWVSGLSVSVHPLVFLLFNFIFPWTALFSYLFERERRRIGEHAEIQWKELNELEVYLSAATQFQFQTQTWAKISPERVFRAQGLRHPLIESTRVVSNNVVWDSTVGIVVLTGSNMSGKSTFLRTLALNFLLANSGFPVFAEELETFSGELLTCIRVSDSLRDGFSYFFAEVRRLKEMMDEIESAKPVFFIIDEIFKGTNNRERLIGSRSLIRHLAHQPQALGVIATHDLELASLEAEIKTVRNYHFREDVVSGKMVFHYLLRPGPSPSTNALIIMKAQGLPVEPTQH